MEAISNRKRQLAIGAAGLGLWGLGFGAASLGLGLMGGVTDGQAQDLPLWGGSFGVSAAKLNRYKKKRDVDEEKKDIKPVDAAAHAAGDVKSEETKDEKQKPEEKKDDKTEDKEVKPAEEKTDDKEKPDDKDKESTGKKTDDKEKSDDGDKESSGKKTDVKQKALTTEDEKKDGEKKNGDEKTDAWEKFKKLNIALILGFIVGLIALSWYCCCRTKDTHRVQGGAYDNGQNHRY